MMAIVASWILDRAVSCVGHGQQQKMKNGLATHKSAKTDCFPLARACRFSLFVWNGKRRGCLRVEFPTGVVVRRLNIIFVLGTSL
jgi:hypothetical protein